MEQLILVCKPDKNGVYRIGDRYINLKKYIDPCSNQQYTVECPVCEAYQCKPYDGICAVCGFDMFHSDKKEFLKFKETHKEKIKNLQINYGK